MQTNWFQPDEEIMAMHSTYLCTYEQLTDHLSQDVKPGEQLGFFNLAFVDGSYKDNIATAKKLGAFLRSRGHLNHSHVVEVSCSAICASCTGELSKQSKKEFIKRILLEKGDNCVLFIPDLYDCFANRDRLPLVEFLFAITENSLDERICTVFTGTSQQIKQLLENYPFLRTRTRRIVKIEKVSMNMKCPVCKNDTAPNDKECGTCGFTELYIEFLNVEEAENWHRTVVMPARALWNAAQKMQEKALAEYQKLEKKTAVLKKKYDGLLADYESLKKDFNTLAPLSPKVPASATNPKPGWNTTGPIAHPNFAACSYQGTRFELSNISAERSGNTIKICFVAKKTYDRSGATATNHIQFSYKVKDPAGMVVSTDFWIKGGLSVGDAMQDKIFINNIVSDGYSIEISDG